MAILLGVSDATDGTGGTAAVTGSNVASTNTLYKAPWTGTTGALTWTLVGSRTGDGTLAIASAAGFFLFRLDNLLTGVTTVLNVYQPLTDATTQAMLYRAMVSAKNRVDGLALGVTTSVRWLPRKQMSSEGTIIAITPVNSETFPGIMNATDDIGLPFAVVVMDPSNQDPTLNLNRNLLWRERILSALRYQRLAGVAEGYICNPEPAMIVNPGMFDAENLTFSPLFFRLITRTVRG